MQKRMMLLAVMLMGLFSLSGALMAQSDEIVLTISLNHTNVLSERLLQGFYETHPNVRIVVNGVGEMSYGGPIKSVNEIDAVLNKAEQYFNQSDILTVSMNNLHPFATRAGYVLDMTPYIQADSKTYEDFYPVALKMYQWDGGLWGLPVALTPWFMTYDPTAFEAAGYPPPDESWTLDDYLDAARALTERDANGAITQPGFVSSDRGYLIGPIMGLRFYDDSTQSEMPLLAHPNIEDMFAKLKTYSDELANSPGVWRYSEMPLQLGGLWRLTDQNEQTPYMPASLSAEHILVAGDGFAISARTQHPQLAYEFIAYLASDIEVAAYYTTDMLVPARRSLAGQSSAEWDFPAIPAVIEAQLPDILENGIPTSEVRYGEYLYPALDKIYTEPTLTVHEVLQQAQQEAIDNLKVAEARREDP